MVDNVKQLQLINEHVDKYLLKYGQITDYRVVNHGMPISVNVIGNKSKCAVIYEDGHSVVVKKIGSRRLAKKHFNKVRGTLCVDLLVKPVSAVTHINISSIIPTSENMEA